MIGGGDGDCRVRSGLAIMSLRMTGSEEASSSLRKAAFSLPSPSTAAPILGAEESHGRDRPCAPEPRIHEGDAGEEDVWSDQVMAESDDNGGPVWSISSRT